MKIDYIVLTPPPLNGEMDKKTITYMEYILNLIFGNKLFQVKPIPKPFSKYKTKNKKQAALSIIPLSILLEKMKAQLIDQYKPKGLKLYEIKGKKFDIDEDIKILEYSCPSTGRQYFDFVLSNISNAAEAMAFKFKVSKETYINNFVVET